MSETNEQKLIYNNQKIAEKAKGEKEAKAKAKILPRGLVPGGEAITTISSIAWREHAMREKGPPTHCKSEPKE